MASLSFHDETSFQVPRETSANGRANDNDSTSYMILLPFSTLDRAADRIMILHGPENPSSIEHSRQVCSQL